VPHQCLSCGFAFEEGSSALLKGCPECKGTRFFYTAEAVDADKRKQIALDAKDDLRQVVTELLAEAAPETAEKLRAQADADGWTELRPKDLRRLVKQVQAEAKQADVQTGLDPEAPIAPSEHAKRRQQAAEAAKRMLAETDEEAKPDTVTVGETGQYAIDVRGLLEKDPLVIQKDGAYLIHLPSLFQRE